MVRRGSPSARPERGGNMTTFTVERIDRQEAAAVRA
jgi:hypothetical protein